MKQFSPATLILLFSFLIANSSFGQQRYTTEIIRKADSLLISLVGNDIFERHYQLDTTSYLETKTAFNPSKIIYLTKQRKVPGKLKYCSVRYTFYITKYEQPSVWTNINFDKNLNLERPIDTSYIPNFIREKRESDFLTKDDALKTATPKFVRTGVNRVETSIFYDHFKKIYVWYVANIIREWKDTYGKPNKEVELVEIDASNGLMLSYRPDVLQGPIY